MVQDAGHAHLHHHNTNPAILRLLIATPKSLRISVRLLIRFILFWP
jgi:hypothetical protein